MLAYQTIVALGVWLQSFHIAKVILSELQNRRSNEDLSTALGVGIILNI